VWFSISWMVETGMRESSASLFRDILHWARPFLMLLPTAIHFGGASSDSSGTEFLRTPLTVHTVAECLPNREINCLNDIDI
jgi:hypothetical protein